MPAARVAVDGVAAAVGDCCAGALDATIEIAATHSDVRRADMTNSR
jgi:hypothetical protein